MTTSPLSLRDLLLSDNFWQKPLIDVTERDAAERLLFNGPRTFMPQQQGPTLFQLHATWPGGATTQVTVERSSSGMSLHRYCTCQGAFRPTRCAHTNAVLLHFRKLDARPPSEGIAKSEWLQLLNQLRTDEPSEPTLPGYAENHDRYHGLILAEGGGHLCVQPVVVSRNRRTGNLRTGKVRPDVPVVSLPQEQLSTEQCHLILSLTVHGRQAIQAFDHQTRSDLQTEAHSLGYRISDHVQVHRFLQLAPVLPLYWKDAKTPVTWSPRRALSFQWAEQPGGQKLVAMVDGAAANGHLLTMCDQPVYVDTAAASVAVLDGSVQALTLAAKAPAIPNAVLEDLRERLSKAPRHWRIPLPESADGIPDLRAAPKLAIDVDRAGTGVFRLFYEYDGLRPTGASVGYEQIAYPDGRKVRLHRDPDAEEALRDRLGERVNLYPNGNGTWGVRSGGYLGTPLSPEETTAVLQTAALEMGASFNAPANLMFRLATLPHAITGDISATTDKKWFDVGVGVEIEGRRFDLLPILSRMIISGQLDMTAPSAEDSSDAIWIDAGEKLLVPVPVTRLRQIAAPILDWLRRPTFQKKGRLRIRASAYGAVEGLTEVSQAEFIASKGAFELVERIKNRRQVCLPSPRFLGSLRDYQQNGLNWLAALADCHFGGVLADDMGLGKTIQTIAHVVTEKDGGELAEPVLVVTLKSVMNQWVERFAEFAPHLRVQKISGAGRDVQYDEIPKHDVIVTSWPLLVRDLARWRKQKISLLVLDETKDLKNPRNLAAQAVREIKAGRRLALGGTPIENNLGEFWSIMDIVEPGVLGSREEFNEHFRNPIEKSADSAALDRLRRRISAICLRRTKADVSDQLPPKTTEVVHLDLAPSQRDLYEGTRAMVSDEVMALLAEKGVAKAGMIALTKMLTLRQICASPALLKASKASAAASAKEEWIEENVPRLMDEGRRVLVFSEWAEMLSKLAERLKAAGVQFSYLTGSSSDNARTDAIRDFKSGKTALFLITRKAGGVALDLPEADTVIHYEPDWNPANENQASDRAHRLSTTHPVTVYKLIARGTLEDQILEMQKRKEGLRAAVLDGRVGQEFVLTEEDIRALLAPISDGGQDQA